MIQSTRFKNILKYGFYELIIVVWAIILINVYVLSFSLTQYFSHVDDIAPSEVGLVLGSSVRADGTPGMILQDRLITASTFYHKGKINKILVSWDNSSHHYNEPLSMQQYLIDQWVAKQDIYLDYAGFDTYDSLYRARDVFGSRDLMIFTQSFHLHRAIYIAKRLDMNVIWVTTDLQAYHGKNRNSIREIWARVKAFIEVEITRPQPTYLWEPIEIVSNTKLNQAKQDILWE